MIDSFFKMKVDENGKLVPFSKADARKMTIFLNALPKDIVIDTFMGYYEGTEKTLQQLAKVHVCIKEIADYTHASFKSIKETIKENCGLYQIESTVPYKKVLKSFEFCTKDELNAAIEQCELVLDIIYDSGED